MSRGRPSLDVAERLRRRIWYAHVMRRSGMSHYLMDSLFDLNPENKPNNSNKKKDKRRVRIFDAIRDHDWMPFREHMVDFIKAIDEYKTRENQTPLKGTADLFFSKFWELMRPTEMSLVDLRQFLLDCMNRLGMLAVCERTEVSERLIEYFASSHSHQEFDQSNFHFEFYEFLLKQVIEPIPDNLDKLALLGAMLREAYYAGCLDFCLLLNRAYNTVLDNLTNSELIPDQHKTDFFKLASQRVLGSFFQQKGQHMKSYISLLKSPLEMQNPAGLILVEHDLVFWAKNNIENEMRERINGLKTNPPARDDKPSSLNWRLQPQKDEVEQWVKEQSHKHKKK